MADPEALKYRASKRVLFSVDLGIHLTTQETVFLLYVALLQNTFVTGDINLTVKIQSLKCQIRLGRDMNCYLSL